MAEKVIGHKFIGLINIIMRRFWDITRVNIFSLIFYLPSLIVLFFILIVTFPTNIEALSSTLLYTIKDAALLDLLIKMTLGLVLVTIPIVVFGPAVAGASNVYKIVIANQSCQVWTVFWDTIKKYFVKSFIISAISTIVMFLMLLSLRLWLQLASKVDVITDEFMLFLLESKFVYGAIMVILILFAVIFIMMHLYIYQLLVQYDLPISKLYKYAYTFALLRFLPNLLILIVCIVITLLPFWLHYLFGGGMIFLVTIGLCSLVINYYTWPAIEKHFEPLVNRK